MFKFAGLFAAAVILAFAVTQKSTPIGGSWQVDTGHSDAQVITDATTDYGKTKISITLGFARVNGRVVVDNDDPAKSSFVFGLYPALSKEPVTNEDGKFLSEWLANLSNHTLVSFHSKQVVREADGRLKATGNLVVTRVDRNIEATPSEAYAGPVYGPPMIHRVSHEATFVFDVSTADKKRQKNGGIVASGSAKIFEEDYPQLVRSVLRTYWPPVVQDESCQASANAGAADYDGLQCKGSLLKAPALPEAPHAANAEDYSAASNFNSIVGNRLNILINLHLVPKSSSERMATGG
jgi:polyisoprenoid-binding protein YceI